MSYHFQGIAKEELITPSPSNIKDSAMPSIYDSMDKDLEVNGGIIYSTLATTNSIVLMTQEYSKLISTLQISICFCQRSLNNWKQLSAGPHEHHYYPALDSFKADV
ncbi:hypothetical protein ECG_03171 [Echinococcus granulosus]|nr:hypothetical protein ECG_03171 [Echinococcus granulosus]